ncbi:MAG TPA: hypothetical protein VE843_16780 [Ktedonobacteraceae bacterium]|nr:hypothetical protein [Ktedonobacteraceae bacterium]
MKFSLPSRRSSKARQKGKEVGMVRLDSAKERLMEKLPLAKGKLKSSSPAWAIVVLAWAIATALASVSWAIASYLIEREKQRTQVELARLERKAKKKGSSN